MSCSFSPDSRNKSYFWNVALNKTETMLDGIMGFNCTDYVFLSGVIRI